MKLAEEYQIPDFTPRLIPTLDRDADTIAPAPVLAWLQRLADKAVCEHDAKNLLQQRFPGVLKKYTRTSVNLQGLVKADETCVLFCEHACSAIPELRCSQLFMSLSVRGALLCFAVVPCITGEAMRRCLHLLQVAI